MNDEECRYVGTSLSTSCRGSADAFARSLRRRFNTLNIGNQHEDTDTTSTWYQNGHGHDPFASSPLSPENEITNPLSNGNHFINPEVFLNTKPIEFTGCDRSSAFISENGNDICIEETDSAVSPAENFIDSSSVDDNYETASDLSADEIDVVGVETLQTEPLTSISETGYLIEETAEVSNTVCNIGGNSRERSYSPLQDAEDISTPKIRRCSSLKSGKTPPGTPGGKKIVRFADALGLDLADVKTFVDEIPKIPTSAYNDLNTLDDEADDFHLLKPYSNTHAKSALIPLFTQPGERFDFMERIRRCNVCLESAVLDDPISCSIKGVVRVRNIDFHKSVFVRYSTDRWRNSVDVQASYVNNSCDGYSDKFSFLIYANMLRFGDKLEFAVCFLAKGNEYWDNNDGTNYVFECISTQTVTLAPLVIPPSWGHESFGAAFY
ncbi:glycogen-binding subunit 76A [Coccinella septempunctata]|uniref:glycogen-binding subunit 76A n=1 Tax=Coccinella septempunctata TaxID=41139 RepID=UPI001D083A28|nr:glycogen-binding subunit 76A [Coccinella septempunctata]